MEFVGVDDGDYCCYYCYRSIGMMVVIITNLKRLMFLLLSFRLFVCPLLFVFERFMCFHY